MNTSQVHIDFKQLGVAFREYIREKAVQANSTIVYYKGDVLIEENPKSEEKRVLKEFNQF